MYYLLLLKCVSLFFEVVIVFLDGLSKINMSGIY